MLGKILKTLRPKTDEKGRVLTVKERLLLKVEKLMAHPKNASGNNMSQR